jgi:deoxyribonuclease IV
MTTLRIGGHVDQADPLAEAKARDATLSQFFLGDPQGWKGPVVAYPGGAQALRHDATSADIALYVHSPYVINVATTNNRIRIPSRKLLQQTVDASAEVGAAAVIVHGGHVLADDELDVGLDNWRKTFERLDAKVPVLVENTAGGDRAMARRLDAIARLWDVVGSFGAGFCLDTCHAWAGGIELADVVDRILAISDRIDLVHANDSKDGFDSGRDRHENFEAGSIGPDAIAAVVRAAGAPVVCETPGGASGQGADIAVLRSRLPA